MPMAKGSSRGTDEDTKRRNCTGLLQALLSTFFHDPALAGVHRNLFHREIYYTDKISVQLTLSLHTVLGPNYKKYI